MTTEPQGRNKRSTKAKSIERLELSREPSTESVAVGGLPGSDASVRTSILEEFNRIGHGNAFPDNTKKWEELAVGVQHPIRRARAANTKYGRRVVLDLYDDSSIFLPARFATFSDDNIAKINNGHFAVVNNGMQSVGKATFIQVELVPITIHVSV